VLVTMNCQWTFWWDIFISTWLYYCRIINVYVHFVFSTKFLRFLAIS